MHDRRLIVVSNRLPVSMSKDETTGGWKLAGGDGGLVSALSPALSKQQSIWIGWTGANASLDEAADVESAASFQFEMKGIPLSETEIELYYRGFSNEIIWPLFHGFLWLCNFDPKYWPVYDDVNRKFARAAAEAIRDGDFLWIHDYHLMLVRRELQKQGVTNPAGFFLHIPFPSLDGFQHLPWREELLSGLLAHDVIGFQTSRDLNNFLHCVEANFEEAEIHRENGTAEVEYNGRSSVAGVFPISIDFDKLSDASGRQKVMHGARSLRASFKVEHVMLGIDRLDYTKGIPDRLRAFADSLATYPEMQQRIMLVQVVVPSRTDVPMYQEMKDEIERLVGEINGRFSAPGWIPVHYMYRNLDRDSLWSYYLNADIALITPLRDGMNLVAKEYCACNVKEDGVLVLSEFAGAAEELAEHALLVNPHDVKALAGTIHDAFSMPIRERRKRMRGLRKVISEHNVFDWVDSFLDSANRVESQRQSSMQG